MGLDDTVNLERIATAFEKIAWALEGLARQLDERNRIERERLAYDHPPHRDPKPAEVIHPDEDRRNLYSDRPTEQWSKETEAALPENKSRFQERLDATRQPEKPKPQGGRTAPVSKT